MNRRLLLLSGLAVPVSMAGCGPTSESPPVVARSDVMALEKAIAGLGDSVRSDEAARAAQLAYDHSRALAVSYQIEDGPIVHNRKVNRGEKPRGLCWHWAEDMEKRLKREDFASLDMHRAIANGHSPILLAHSTAIISAKGDPMQRGIVLDPWRFGGRLYWGAVSKDTRYVWRPRAVVLAEKRGRLLTGQPKSDL